MGVLDRVKALKNDLKQKAVTYADEKKKLKQEAKALEDISARKAKIAYRKAYSGEKEKMAREKAREEARKPKKGNLLKQYGQYLKEKRKGGGGVGQLPMFGGGK